ncbi:hypothetical protein PENSPDRAFT_373464 [Peniophora sp. CONT]|nr:hypothetical protein PENSPDRAFT_373464 [Peniophora sp. CONT]
MPILRFLACAIAVLCSYPRLDIPRPLPSHSLMFILSQPLSVVVCKHLRTHLLCRLSEGGCTCVHSLSPSFFSPLGIQCLPEHGCI